MDDPIADSKPKSFSDEDFIELLEKIKDLYECLREAEAMGKKHMDLIAELEKITASK